MVNVLKTKQMARQKAIHDNLMPYWKNAPLQGIDFRENLWISDKRDENDRRDRVCGIISP
jgi:hypothetical protein